MKVTWFSLVVCTALGLSVGTVDAMPLGATAGGGGDLPIVKVAEGCGPGFVRPGCGKPIGAGLRTPC